MNTGVSLSALFQIAFIVLAAMIVVIAIKDKKR